MWAIYLQILRTDDLIRKGSLFQINVILSKIIFLPAFGDFGWRRLHGAVLSVFNAIKTVMKVIKAIVRTDAISPGTKFLYEVISGVKNVASKAGYITAGKRVTPTAIPITVPKRQPKNENSRYLIMTANLLIPSER